MRERRSGTAGCRNAGGTRAALENFRVCGFLLASLILSSALFRWHLQSQSEWRNPATYPRYDLEGLRARPYELPSSNGARPAPRGGSVRGRACGRVCPEIWAPLGGECRLNHLLSTSAGRQSMRCPLEDCRGTSEAPPVRFHALA